MCTSCIHVNSLPVYVYTMYISSLPVYVYTLYTCLQFTLLPEVKSAETVLYTVFIHYTLFSFNISRK